MEIDPDSDLDVESYTEMDSESWEDERYECEQMLQANTKKSKPASCRRQYYWDGAHSVVGR